MKFIYVALGGAIGAMGRYAVGLIPIKSGFPILTLVTNIIGALIIGFIVGVVNNKGCISPNIILFLKTGLCGGFTTFSTFSLETFEMIEDKSYGYTLLYVILSVICCIFSVAVGEKAAVVFITAGK
ncbi:MAG: fluoride efflux transporter CrcB [Firmicutes bacterium]|nr:fluoride efflux transporter CrcB [Bacillota bacterium]